MGEEETRETVPATSNIEVSLKEKKLPRFGVGNGYPGIYIHTHTHTCCVCVHVLVYACMHVLVIT